MGQGLKGRRIILGVTGGIAAYKAAELLRLLIKEGASVWVAMTRASQQFITPLTFQALSGHPVSTDLFDLHQESAMSHIGLAEKAELLIIAPATANIIGKLAAGIGDDLLSTLVLATKSPVLVCPAMNVNMYEHPVVQKNLDALRSIGYHVVEPEAGELACGWEGKGRLAALENILEEALVLVSEKDLRDETVMVTAGPTREPIDPVRFLSNRSSGKMGYAIAREARRRGAKVILITGPTDLRPPVGVNTINISSASQMYDAVMEHLEEATIVVKAAAVADYRPAKSSKSKIKKAEGCIQIRLERTRDILAEVAARKDERILVGFAAETEDLLENALNKLKQKNLDLIVANDVTRPGAGFEADTNMVKLIDRQGRVSDLPMMSKQQVAEKVFDKILALKKGLRPA